MPASLSSVGAGAGKMRRQILPYFSSHFIKTHNILRVQQADR